jgi:hypothetical protein
MDRKYRQSGYQDGGAPERERPEPRPAKDHEGPKSPNMMAFQGVVRCAMCGARVELTGISAESACPNCKSDLRTCRNCTSFDPGARFECRAGVSARVSNKTVRNACDLFAARHTVEKKTGEARGSSKSDDPRAAFDRLFKK